MWRTRETIICSGAGNKVWQLHSWLLSTESGGVSRLTELFLPFCPYRDLSNNRIGCLSPEMFLDLSSLYKLWVCADRKHVPHFTVGSRPHLHVCGWFWKRTFSVGFVLPRRGFVRKKLFKGGTEKKNNQILVAHLVSCTSTMTLCPKNCKRWSCF